MPLIQTPQWTEFLSCPVCYNEFNESVRRPISLGCGHTVCKTCLSQLQRKQCPFDQAPITQDIDDLPANYALLQLVGAEVTVEQQKIPANVVSQYMKHYAEAKACIEELALYLKPLGLGGTGSSNCILSRPMQRKLVTLVNCQLVEEEGRSRAMRAARSLGERTVTELMLQHQNTQQLSANLWAAVRARGCQFLGPAMQEETLKLVLLALEDGAALSRKVLVMFVVQRLEQQFPQASKTSVGHVVQLLYRASCFKVTKREEESSLMQLKEEFRNYEALRREHDAQIVQIAMEGGLRISPEQWSSLLYGDLNHKSHMQSIIDKLQTPASFTSSIQELTIALQRSGDPANLNKLRCHLKLLADINPNPESEPPAWEDVENAMVSAKIVVHGLVEFITHHSHTKKVLEQQQTQNIKYKTSMCRDITQKGGCPRGNNCTFAHSEDELDKYRAKSRRMLSTLNRQNSNQSVRSISSQFEKPSGNKLVARGVTSPTIGMSVNPMSADPGADLGVLEKNMKRELTYGANSGRNVASPEPPSEKGDDRPNRHMPYPTSEVQVPYRPPPVHYEHYSRDHRGYSPAPPGQYPPSHEYRTQPPRHPGPPYYGRTTYDTPEDAPEFPYDLSEHELQHMRRHQDRGNYAHPHYLDQDPHPRQPSFPYETASRRDAAQGSSLHSSPYHHYQSPSHYNHDLKQFESVPSHPNHVMEDLPPQSPPPNFAKMSESKHSSKHSSKHHPGLRLKVRPDRSDGLPEQRVPADIVEKQEKEHTEKEEEQESVENYLKNIKTPSNIPTSPYLPELQERQKELVSLLNDYQLKKPWDQSALTKTVSTYQGRPKSSVSFERSTDRAAMHNPNESSNETHGMKYFDPWTSSAPFFTFLKPGKEPGTKYTMTVSKSQIKHVSAKETEQMAIEKPHQGKDHPEFANMGLAELRETIEKVKMQDHHTGCTHFERSQQLNQELRRRERMPSAILDESHHVNTTYEHVMERDFTPVVGSSPVSRASRTSFKVTPPVKVNAGPTGPGGGSPCTPVSINISNQMVPLAGQSPVADKNLDIFHRGLGDMAMLSQRSGEPDENHREQQQIKEELEEELAKVSSQIAKQKTVKTANDAFLIQRESRALRGSLRTGPLPGYSQQAQEQRDIEMARRLQREEFEELEDSQSVHDAEEVTRSSSPFGEANFTMDRDFPPLRAVLDQEANDRRIAEAAQRYENAETAQRYENSEAAQRYENAEAMRQSPYQQRQYEQEHHFRNEAFMRQRVQQEMNDHNVARQLARQEARAMGVRLPPEKSYNSTPYRW